LEHHYVRYLADHATVFTYPAEEVFNDYYHASPVHKVLYRLGLSRIHRTVGEGLLAAVEQERPDVVWVFKGMRVTPAVLQALRDRGIRLANYNPDHPFLFSSRGSGNRNVTDSIGLYDLHLCYSRAVMERISSSYGIATARLPFAMELPEADYAAIEEVPEIARACFVGNPDETRVEHLLAMAKGGVALDVFGHGWEGRLPRLPHVRIHDAVYGLEYWRTIRAYRVQLNIFRPHNVGNHNMRTFEVPGAGGILLAPDSPEHREFFREGQEIFLYRNKEDMVGVARQLLSMPSEEAAAVRRRARDRSVADRYTYRERAAQAAAALAALL
jgi:hypothetical protein